MKPCLKKVIISNLKNLKINDTIISQITNISIHIINAGFNKEKLFSGNIDSRLIREKAEEYGFSCKTDYSKTGDGSDLRTIKDNRNDLAHGVKSFAEVGKDKSADELLTIKNKVIKYLRQILLNIENYLANKEYLDSAIGTC